MTSLPVNVACFGDYGEATSNILGRASVASRSSAPDVTEADETTHSIHRHLSVDFDKPSNVADVIGGAWDSLATCFIEAADAVVAIPFRLDLCCAISSDDTTRSIGSFGDDIVGALAELDLGPLDQKIDDPWSSHGQPTWRYWPYRWHRLVGGNGGMWHTRSEQGAVGLWVVIVPTTTDGASVGSEALGVDRGGTAGPLAAYITALGRARIHAMASYYWLTEARRSDDVLTGVADADKLAVETSRLAKAVAGLQEADGNLAPVNANLQRSRSRMTQWLHELGAETNTISYWEREQGFDDESRNASVRGNHTRYQARLTDLMERSRHADARAGQRESRANTRATLLLAIAAGALAMGALASDTAGSVSSAQAKGGLTATGAGLLLALAVLVGVLPARKGAARWFQAIGLLAGGLTAGIGWGVATSTSMCTWARYGLGGFLVAGAVAIGRVLWDNATRVEPDVK